MSYSFTVYAATQAEASAKVAEELAKVAQAQPCHETDIQQAQAAADAFIAVLPAGDPTQELRVSVSGSLGWSGTWGDGHTITSASVGVSAHMAAKMPAVG